MLDVVLYRGVQDAWICLRGLESLGNLKRWIEHIDWRLGDRAERFDEDSVTLENVIEAIKTSRLKKNSEQVSKCYRHPPTFEINSRASYFSELENDRLKTFTFYRETNFPT